MSGDYPMDAESACSSDDEIFQGYSLYDASTPGGLMSESEPVTPCGVRPDATRSFQARVEELLRARVSEVARSPKRHCGAGRFGSPAGAPSVATHSVTPQAGAGKHRKRAVTVDMDEADDDDAPRGSSSSSSSAFSDSDDDDDVDDEVKMTPLSRSGSASRIEDLLAQAGGAPPPMEGETPTLRAGPKKIVTPLDRDAPAPAAVSAFAAAEALLMVSR